MIAALLIVPLIVGNQPVVPDYLAMQDAYTQGTVGAGEYLSLILQGMESPETLPDEFLTILQGRGICLTTVVRDAIEGARQDPQAQDLASRLPFRPQKQASFVSPDGLFTVHYDTTGYHAVYQPEVDVDPVDGVPDYVNRCAEIFDHCWHVEVDSMGFYAPGSDNGLGGSDNYDVYLHRTGAYGVTYREGQASEYEWDAWYSHIHVDPAYDGFGYVDRLDPLKVTAAHEFQHACQFSYDGNENGAWMEQCATWMEDIIYDDINDYINYLPDFFEAPHQWLYSTAGLFPYGACVWPHYLVHNYGQAVIEAIWEECITTGAVQAVDEILQTMGSSRSTAVADFRVWNYFTGNRDDGQHYEEGSTWPSVHIMADQFDLPVLDGAPADGQNPGGLGCNYIRFRDLSELPGLRVQFANESSGPRDWIVEFIVTGLDLQEYGTLVLDGDEGMIALEFEGASTVVMIPSCVSLSTGDYSYWARDIRQIANLERIIVDDFQGNGDGRPEAGEQLHLGAVVSSIVADWESTTMIVRTGDPSLSVTDSVAAGGALFPGGSVEIPAEDVVIEVASEMEPHIARIELLLGPSEQEIETTFMVDLQLGIPELLVYDADGGDDVQSFVEASLESLGVVHDVWDEQTGAFPAFPQAELSLPEYDVLIWLTGDAGNSLSVDDLAEISGLLDSGQHLLLSGQDIAESLAATAEGQEFMNDWLGVQYDGYQSHYGLVGPEDDPLYGGMSFVTSGFGMDGANNQTSRDRLLPGDDVSLCLEYNEGHAAAIRREIGSSRLVFCGFGIEAIVDNNQNANNRREFLDIALDYLENGIVSVTDVPAPRRLAITSVWPNPASTSLKAHLLIPASSTELRASLVDIAGRAVTTLPVGRGLLPGEALVTFRVPETVPSGFYFLHVQQDDTRRSVPVTILK